MTLNQPHKKEQLIAIQVKLQTAPQIQKQLKEKYAYGENMFFDLDLIEYRINNFHKDIAEDLDIASLYGITSDVAEKAVGLAFLGHDNKEFFSWYQFEGLFGKQLNDIIRKSRKTESGRIVYHKGLGKINPEQKSKNSQKAYAKSLGKLTHKQKSEIYAKGLGKLTTEERLENARKAAEAKGNHIWSLEDLVSLNEIRMESIGKGYYKKKPCWNYVTEEFNRQHGTDLTRAATNEAYRKYCK